MNDYYEVVISDDDRWHYEVNSAVAPLDIWACQPIEMPEPMRFKVSVQGKRVDFGHTGWAGIPVISSRMGDALQSVASDDIQLLPAVVEGEPNGDWVVLNVLARSDCLDHKKSKITYRPPNDPERPGKPRGVMYLTIDSSRVGSHQVFRIKDWEGPIIVSEQVKSLLEVIGITGCEFWKVTR